MQSFSRGTRYRETRTEEEERRRNEGKQKEEKKPSMPSIPVVLEWGNVTLPCFHFRFHSPFPILVPKTKEVNEPAPYVQHFESKKENGLAGQKRLRVGGLVVMSPR
jgi:hypothetical protein